MGKTIIPNYPIRRITWKRKNHKKVKFSNF